MKEYREVQVSTAALIFIILGIIILGTVIFFMGVQVGKKQTDLLAKSFIVPKTEEKVSQDKPVIPDEQAAQTGQTQTSDQTELSSQTVSSDHQTALETKPAETATETTVQPAVGSSGNKTEAARRSSETAGGNYFVQVGAFNDLSSARLAADRFKKQGYRTVIKDPYPADKKTVYRVWLGGYQTREEARRIVNELAKKSVKNPGYFVVQQ
ncbi:MAG: SPOR domain-containing protein [Acidobacteriota bacterium]|nr:SPOR domain-containing protein [Acidobacteriota bacterium]